MDFGKTKFEVAKGKNHDQFLSEQGIEDMDIMRSLGIFLITIAIIGIIILFYFIVRLANKRFKLCTKLQEVIAKKMFFSGILRYIIVGYLKLFNQFASLICY